MIDDLIENNTYTDLKKTAKDAALSTVQRLQFVEV